MLLKILPLGAIFALAATPTTVAPDEGQWLPTQVRNMDWEDLRSRGMRMTRDEFWHPEKGGVLSAAVHINGCTASFVSSEGLTVTNHHCGFGAIAALSSVDANYLEEGFVARNRSQELPAEGVVVKVLKKIVDVTDEVHAAQDEADSDIERWAATRQVIARLERGGEEAEPGTECQVAEYLEGREYHLIFRTVIPDVRLVYAPPRSVGEFGGEVDNWEWPRHTGDFSFFRAYVGPDGSPRPYDEANVPFRPEHHLAVCTDGVREGDMAIIMGYPGSTQRYRTSAAVRHFQAFVYPRRKDVLDRAMAVLQAAADSDDELALELASPMKSMANVQKNAEGMVWGLDRNAVVERKLREEEEFQRWVEAEDARAREYGKVLNEMLELDTEEQETAEKDFLLSFVAGYVGRQVPFLTNMVRACEVTMNYGKLPPQLEAVLRSPAMTANFDTVQRPLLELILEEAVMVGDEMAGSDAFGATGEATLRRVLESDAAKDADARVEAFATAESIAKSEDPLVILVRGIVQERSDYFRRNRERDGRKLVVGQKWIEAQQAWRGKTFYPDANSTLRVSIAKVEGYVPRDGVRYTPHTTVGGILAKETGEEPFASPDALRKAAPSRRNSRFYDWQLDDVPVCFLTNGDTTGGNSGSPVINGGGELIGLNFDRVFENVSGDFGWHPARSRNISVDIRYVLLIMESVMPAPELLQEMGVMTASVR